MTKIHVIIRKNVGSRKFRVASYFNEDLGCTRYRVEQYKKNGWERVGALASDYEHVAIAYLENKISNLSK